jgi:hypothetical protein
LYDLLRLSSAPSESTHINFCEGDFTLVFLRPLKILSAAAPPSGIRLTLPLGSFATTL